MEQLTIEDAGRQWHIDRLSRSLERWRAVGTDLSMPEAYERYCNTLAHLKAGGAYVVHDVTEDCLRACAKGIHAAVMAGDRAERIRRGKLRDEKAERTGVQRRR